MKVIAYNISQIDKEFLALANHKRHKMTIISVPLDEATVYFAQAKDVVIITGDACSVSPSIFEILISLGVRYIIAWLNDPLKDDVPGIQNDSLRWTSVRNADPSGAWEVINIINRWQKDDDDHN